MAEKPGRPKKTNTQSVTPNNTIVGEQTNYKELYERAQAEADQLKGQVAEYQKVCESYAKEKQQMTQQYNQMALEYRAKTEYALDCAKHAYLSIQLAMKK